MRTGKHSKAPHFDLMPDEMTLIRHCRAMSEQEADNMIDFAAATAIEKPRQKAPALKLIAGGKP